MTEYHATPAELAEITGIQESVVQKWCERGWVKAWKENGVFVVELPVSLESLKRFVQTSKAIAEKYGEIDDFER